MQNAGLGVPSAWVLLRYNLIWKSKREKKRKSKRERNTLAGNFNLVAHPDRLAVPELLLQNLPLLGVGEEAGSCHCADQTSGGVELRRGEERQSRSKLGNLKNSSRQPDQTRQRWREEIALGATYSATNLICRV